MRKQKNILQTKQKGKNIQDQINEEETCNLFEKKKKFRVMIVKMIQNIDNRMDNI